ncbi:hypothetical protein CRG98_027039 [Punica granatum]|uniref:Uncharacterized protein n=1 Tax=Punica granatum TaxID=22663 RepID=A0A2I0J8K6_PUNGR|nr:hypothetical protein CRG98_027039 [Punica granatum]
MASTIAFEFPASKEKYLESLGDGSDLLGNNKVENHRLHTHGKTLKFLISNVVFDIPTLVKQIEDTCRGHVENLGRNVELRSKAQLCLVFSENPKTRRSRNENEVRLKKRKQPVNHVMAKMLMCHDTKYICD